MPNAWKLARWVLVLFPVLAWGTAISGVHGVTPAWNSAGVVQGESWFLPSLLPTSGGSTVADDHINTAPLIEFDNGPAWSPDLSFLAPAAVTLIAADEDIAIWGGSDSEPSLTVCVMMLLLLGALVKYVLSPAFYGVISEVCCTLSAIEHEGRDGRP